MRAIIHPQSGLGMSLRLLAGAVLAFVLGYTWLANTDGYLALLSALLIGAGAGMIMASSWSVLLLPAVLFVSVQLAHAITCADCPVWSEDDSGATLVILSLMVYGAVALGAAAGTFVTHWALRERRDA